MNNDQILDEVQVKLKYEKQGYFVQIPHKMYAFGNECFATNDEWLVYYMLGTLVSGRNRQRVDCNVELLYAKLNFGYFGYEEDSKNKNQIRNALIGLNKKGYIIMSSSEGKIKYNTLLDIFVPKIDPNEEVTSGNLVFKGYTEVYDEMFEDCKGNEKQCVDHLKVLVYVDWRSKIGFKIALSQWGKVLGVSEKTADKILDGCVEAKLIYKERGQYYLDSNGMLKQETNGYSVVSDDDRETVKYNEPSYAKKVNTKVRAAINSDKSIEKRQHNLFGNGRLNEKDYYVWMTTECPVLKDQGKKRIDAISKSEGGKNMVASWKKDAEKIAKQEKNRQLEENLVEARYNAVKNEMFPDKTVEYMPIRTDDDMSEFLEDAPKKEDRDSLLSFVNDYNKENDEDYEIDEPEEVFEEDFLTRQKRTMAKVRSQWNLVRNPA